MKTVAAQPSIEYVCVCMYVRMCACVCVRAHVCACVCVCVRGRALARVCKIVPEYDLLCVIIQMDKIKCLLTMHVCAYV
jgi:hypothetical protein